MADKFILGFPISEKTANSVLYQDGSNIGIGTSPFNTLSIKGSVNQLDIETTLSGTTLESIDRADLSKQSDLSFYARHGNHKFFSGSYAEKMRITSNGNVGIGTTSPAQNFVVADATNGNGVELVPGATATIQTYNRGTSSYNDLNIDTARTQVRSIDYISFHNGSGFPENMRINSAGNVGIGTTNPVYMLDVAGNINISGTGGFLRFNSGDTAIKNEGGYKLGFQTYNSTSATISTKMVLDTDGNVGIGTTSPNSNLEINATDAELRLSSTSQTSNVAKFKIEPLNNRVVLESSSLHVLAFDVNGSERMRIDSSGNVGIGTTSPAAKLEVNGTIKATDINFSGLPTSSSGLSSGDVWNDGGTLKIVS